MALKLMKRGVVEHLKTDEDMASYLEAAMEQAGVDADFIAKVPGDIAGAKGGTQLACDTGMGRESLYKVLSGQGNPSFSTILKVVHALGVRLHAAPALAEKPRRVRKKLGDLAAASSERRMVSAHDDFIAQIQIGLSLTHLIRNSSTTPMALSQVYGIEQPSCRLAPAPVTSCVRQVVQIC